MQSLLRRRVENDRLVGELRKVLVYLMLEQRRREPFAGMRRVDSDHLHESAFFGLVSRRPDVFERLCEHGLDVRFKDGLDSIEPGRPVLPRRK